MSTKRTPWPMRADHVAPEFIQRIREHVGANEDICLDPMHVELMLFALCDVSPLHKAAPDLLKACGMLLESIDMRATDIPETRLRYARAAIAKAKGVSDA